MFPGAGGCEAVAWLVGELQLLGNGNPWKHVPKIAAVGNFPGEACLAPPMPFCFFPDLPAFSAFLPALELPSSEHIFLNECQSRSHRIIKLFGLEGALKVISFQPHCHRQRHLQPNMICLADRNYQQSVTTMEKIREEWQNEHIKACEVNVPKHLHMAVWSSGFAILAAGLRGSAHLLSGKQQDVLQLALCMCLKHGFWIQDLTASRFLFLIRYFYFSTPF